jgi:hypothetical protein
MKTQNYKVVDLINTYYRTLIVATWEGYFVILVVNMVNTC